MSEKPRLLNLIAKGNTRKVKNLLQEYKYSQPPLSLMALSLAVSNNNFRICKLLINHKHIDPSFLENQPLREAIKLYYGNKLVNKSKKMKCFKIINILLKSEKVQIQLKRKSNKDIKEIITKFNLTNKINKF